MGKHGKPRTLSEIARLVRFLWRFAKPHSRLLALTVFFTIIYACVGAARAYLAGGLIKTIREKSVGMTKEEAHAMWHDAKMLAAFAGFLALGLGTSNYLRDFFQESFVMRVVISLREAVTRHVLSLSMRFFNRQKMGELYSRLTNDVQQANQALTYFFGDIVQDVATLAANVAACIWASPLLSLTAVVAGPAVVFPIAKFGSKIRKRARTRQGSQAEVTESMQQMLSGVRTVKAFDREEQEIARFHARNEDLFEKTIRVIKVKSLSKGLLEGINNGLVPLILLGGLWLVQTDRLDASNLAIFVTSLVLMYQPARSITRAYSTLQESLAGLDRLEELLNEKSDLVDAPGARPLEGVRGDVAIRGVSFAYGNEPVLREVTIEAKAGEVVAIVGLSGSGKSTLLDLVARFYDPDAGTIAVDGHDIRQVTRASLVKHLAVVTQDAFLFNDTILENVRYGRPEATMAEVVAACQVANIHDTIAALPQGFDTVVGERGATLSGGQRQRITIARAVLKDPRILLLDEATSALDSESERLVQEALDRIMRGRTTLVVAHRLSTVIGATRIVVIDKGSVVEQGRHEELVARGGLYAKLYGLQSGGEGARVAG